MKNRKNLNVVNTNNDIQWIAVFRNHGHSDAFGDMDFKARMDMKVLKNGIDVKRTISFRFGLGIMLEMEWEIGDKLLLCYDKNNTHNMMLMKHEKGYAISLEGKSEHIARISCPADFLTCDAFGTIGQNIQMDKKNKKVFFKLQTESGAI
jgi:hypothetical protein